MIDNILDGVEETKNTFNEFKKMGFVDINYKNKDDVITKYITWCKKFGRHYIRIIRTRIYKKELYYIRILPGTGFAKQALKAHFKEDYRFFYLPTDSYESCLLTRKEQKKSLNRILEILKYRNNFKN